MTRQLAIPRTDPRDATVGAPLGGSAYVWFNEVAAYRGADDVSLLPSDAVPQADLDRLSRQRPDICGLTMDQPRVMGIVNVTPDSFSDGGDRFSVKTAVEAARVMVADGADILDIGGESTRPGAPPVPETEELLRVVPVIRAIREAGIVTSVSIDTRKSTVAAAALDAGADMVNDVSACQYDSAMVGLIAERDVPICLMHAQGSPETMQDQPTYQDVVAEVFDFLAERIDFAVSAGVAVERIITDPGIGFGKTLDHNLLLLRRLSVLHDLGAPVLLGASRKRFIGTISGANAAKERMPGSLAVALHGATHGMHLLRVHDVLPTVQALRLWRSLA